MSNIGRSLSKALQACAESEEVGYSEKTFVAKVSRMHKNMLLMGAVIMLAIAVGITIYVLIIRQWWLLIAGAVFWLPGLGILALWFGICTYRCVISEAVIQEEYRILFFKRKRIILWQDVKYRIIHPGMNKYIKLYDANRKRLITFDASIVGFERISRLAWRDSIKSYYTKQ